MKTVKLITLLVIMAMPFTSMAAGHKSQSKVTVGVSIDDVNKGITASITNKEKNEVTINLTVLDDEGNIVTTRRFQMAPLSSIEYRCDFDMDPTKKYTTEIMVEGNETELKIDGTTLLNGFRYITDKYLR